jgi:hypothetical protein
MIDAEHAFFIRCYLRCHTDPSFCSDGVLDNASSVVTVPPGDAVLPRASVLKYTSKHFRKMFLAQKASITVSDIGNASLNLKDGGGLTASEQLSTEGSHTTC